MTTHRPTMARSDVINSSIPKLSINISWNMCAEGQICCCCRIQTEVRLSSRLLTRPRRPSMSEIIADISMPDGAMARADTQLFRDTEDDLLTNHSHRVPLGHADHRTPRGEVRPGMFPPWVRVLDAHKMALSSTTNFTWRTVFIAASIISGVLRRPPSP